MTQPQPLTPRRIFWFWVPLAAMWLIMSAEQPAITATVSRLPEATRNLAAFGLTFSFALIIESPVIMLLTAGTALATHRQPYRRLLAFTALLSLALTALHLAMVLTPLYAFILREWVRVPPETIETSRVALLLMTPWTGMIAFRRLWEGVMIRHGQPQRVTWVIVVRLAATVAVLAGGLAVGRWEGAAVGGAALSVGVTVGALAAGWLARPAVRGMDALEGATLGWGRLGHFYLPLALTTLITMVSSPILAFGLSRAPQPLESLAIWPVVMSLVFIGRSLGIAFQEVGVALLRDAQGFGELRRFATRLALGSSGAFALLALTPLAGFWYREVSGLEAELARLALLPTAILAVVPGLNALLSWQRAVLIHNGTTAPISVAVALNMAVLLAAMALGPALPVPGAVLAAGALSLSMVAECAFLWWQGRSVAVLETARGVASAD